MSSLETAIRGGVIALLLLLAVSTIGRFRVASGKTPETMQRKFAASRLSLRVRS